jgi:predicted PurR-regulated permease PerM
MVLLLDLLGPAAGAQLLFEILQPGDQPTHVICGSCHFVYSIGDAGAEMLGIDERVLKGAWTVFLFLMGIALVYSIRSALVTFTMAIFLALLLSPLVTFVDHFTSVKVPRAVSLAVVYIVLVGVLVAALVAVGSAVASEARNLSGRLPTGVAEDPFSRVPLPAWLEPVRQQMGGWLRNRLNEVGNNALTLAGQAFAQVATGFGAAVSVVLVPILAFFFILDGRTLQHSVIRAFDHRHQFLVHEILHDLHKLLSQYLRALVIVAFIGFLAYSAFLTATGSHSAILLGGIAGVLEFIPVVGPLIAVVVIVIVGLFSGYSQWILLAVFVTVYRLALDYGLQPALLSSGMRIHPLLIIFGLLAGGEIGGVVGIFFSVPVIAALRLIFQRLSKQPDAA